MGEEIASENMKVGELISNLSKVQHDLSIAQKMNKRVLGELRTWKEKALKLENSLKQEKRNNQKNITQLGFKMLQFENHLRKEQRDIESKFIDKDNQIKVLEDVINSLQSRIKKNSLCYNCFVVRHNSPERCASPDSYAAKFPLDMDFSDLKPGAHVAPDARNRSISLPLNMETPIESPKPNREICFHHMLSPVPEELEVSVLEHAKMINKESGIEEDATESDIIEEKDLKETIEHTEEEIEDKKELNGQVTESQDESRRNMMVISEGEKDEPVITDYIAVTGAIVENGASQSETDINENEERAFLSDTEPDGRSKIETSEPNVLDQGRADDLALSLNTEKLESELNLENNLEVQQGIHEDGSSLSAEAHSVMNDIISRVEQFIEHKQNLCVENINTDVQDPEFVSESAMEASENMNKKEDGNKMPLSPKSEAIVAELKRAIFDASIELEKRNDAVIQTASANIERTVKTDVCETKINDHQNMETVSNLGEVVCNTDSSESMQRDEKTSDIDLASVAGVNLELKDNGSVGKEDGDLDMTQERIRKDNSVSENCVDTLTEYDVIELD